MIVFDYDRSSVDGDPKEMVEMKKLIEPTAAVVWIALAVAVLLTTQDGAMIIGCLIMAKLYDMDSNTDQPRTEQDCSDFEKG